MPKQCEGFCILPWIHTSIANTGNISPCCRVTTFNQKPFGNLHQENLGSIRNNDQFTEFRKMMLDGQLPIICQRCHQEEANGVSTLRTEFNEKYAELSKQVIEKNITEALPILYGEVRFSNVCNLACRTCNLESSSSWHKEHEEIYAKAQRLYFSHPQREEGLIKEFEPHIKSLESIYFAGGEPLIQNAHYDLLELLLEKGRDDIILVYNTNLTKLQLGKRNALDLWSRFKTIHIYASIDAIGDRFNLIRFGEKWNEVEKNIYKIKLLAPHAEIIFSPTVSVLNLAHIPDLVEYSLEKRLIKNSTFLRFNFLYDPPYYQAHLVPEPQKKILINRMNVLIDKYEQTPQNVPKPLTSFLAQIRAMLATKAEQSLLEEFKTMTKKLDFMRGETTLDVLPELKQIWDQ